MSRAVNIDHPLVSFQTAQVLTDYEVAKMHELVQCLALEPPEALRKASFLKRLPRRIFEREEYKELTRTKRSQIVRSVVYAAVVRQVILHEDIPLPSLDNTRFSFFDTLKLVPIDPTELLRLQGFLRAVETLHSIGLPRRNNKLVYLNVGAALEGSGLMYARGGAPSKATIRRTIIFNEFVHTTPGILAENNNDNNFDSDSSADESPDSMEDLSREDDNKLDLFRIDMSLSSSVDDDLALNHQPLPGLFNFPFGGELSGRHVI